MFITHPSVRIRGTEHNFTPVQCLDSQCAKYGLSHMHCPFCIKSDNYLDPVILKAHYRVKHVDKGIEFAGLKILRCCEQCDIVGAIKGEKKFKGAHWHCYKCKNGFNRRDEAIKHYKTHFRNPQTTFQIQIAQEVNVPLQYYDTLDSQVEVPQGDIQTISHPDITMLTSHDCMNNENDSSVANGRHISMDVDLMQVTTNETIGGTESQAIMIIESHVEDTSGLPINAIVSTQIIDEKVQLQRKVAELENRLLEVEIEKKQIENKLNNEIEQLRLRINMQSQEIVNLQKREQDMMQQLNTPVDSQMEKLFASLQAEHMQLLQHQLQKVTRLALPGI